MVLPTMKVPSSAPTLAASAEAEDASEQAQESKESEVSRRYKDREITSYNPSNELGRQTSSFYLNDAFPGPEESGENSGGLERDEFEVNNIYGGQKMYSKPYLQSSADTKDKVQKVSPPWRKISTDEKPEKTERPGNGSRKDVSSSVSTSCYKKQSTLISNIKSIGTRQNELSSPPRDDNINEILEEEEALIAAHRYVQASSSATVPADLCFLNQHPLNFDDYNHILSEDELNGAAEFSYDCSEATEEDQHCNILIDTFNGEQREQELIQSHGLSPRTIHPSPRLTRSRAAKGSGGSSKINPPTQF